MQWPLLLHYDPQISTLVLSFQVTTQTADYRYHQTPIPGHPGTISAHTLLIDAPRVWRRNARGCGGRVGK